MSVFTLGIFHALIRLMTTGDLGVFGIYAGAAFLALFGSSLVLERPAASVSIFAIGALLMAIYRTEPYEELWPELIILQVSFMIVSGFAYYCHRVAKRAPQPTSHDPQRVEHGNAPTEQNDTLEAAVTTRMNEVFKRLAQSNAGESAKQNDNDI